MPMSTWQQLFPEGRHLYYEGDDPGNFCKKIQKRFGFDPSDDNAGWGMWIPGTNDQDNKQREDGFYSYSFHCPPEFLDDIYGNREYELGS